MSERVGRRDLPVAVTRDARLIGPGSAEFPQVTTQPGDQACLWCGCRFQARRGGSPKRFCSAPHRMAFWSALRRWAERAVTAGFLTVDHIRSDDPIACTLLPGGISPTPIAPASEAHPVAPAAIPDEAAELLDEFS